jgi:hypothetical protein
VPPTQVLGRSELATVTLLEDPPKGEHLVLGSLMSATGCRICSSRPIKAALCHWAGLLQPVHSAPQGPARRIHRPALRIQVTVTSREKICGERLPAGGSGSTTAASERCGPCDCRLSNRLRDEVHPLVGRHVPGHHTSLFVNVDLRRLIAKAMPHLRIWT